MKAYLDTSAWNWILDWSQGRSKRRLAGPEFLFSACNLDEFALSSFLRARDLSRLAWRISNRRKLLDHLELSVAEIHAFRDGTRVTAPYEEQARFAFAWGALRTEGAPANLRARLTQHLGQAKRDVREHIRDARRLFHPVFEAFREAGMERAWPSMLHEIEADGSLARYLRGALVAEDLLEIATPEDGLADIPLRALPCTAAWLEYLIALSFRAAFEPGKDAAADLGDQVDIRHAAYAGYADVFITEDGRMLRVLTDYVIDKKALVQRPVDFVHALTERQDPSGPPTTG